MNLQSIAVVSILLSISITVFSYMHPTKIVNIGDKVGVIITGLGPG